MSDNRSMDQIAAERLLNACLRGEFEYPLLAAPDGTVAVRIADLRHALSMLGVCPPGGKAGADAGSAS